MRQGKKGYYLFLECSSLSPCIGLFLFFSFLIYQRSESPRGLKAKQHHNRMRTEPHACIEIESNATLFSWSTWLATGIAGAAALGRQRHAAWATIQLR